MSNPVTVKPGFRTFLATKEDKTQILLSVRHPTSKEVNRADFAYSATFNECLLAGLPTQAKLMRELRENEVITPQDDARMVQLAENLRAAEAKLKTASEADRPQLQAEKAAAEDAFNAANAEIGSMMEHTANVKANNKQRNFLIACVVERADGPDKGKRLWDSLDALEAETDGDLLKRVLYEYLLCQSNEESRWEELMAEPTVEEKKEEPAKTEVELIPPEKPAENPPA